jgi:hypothetical protein
VQIYVSVPVTITDRPGPPGLVAVKVKDVGCVVQVHWLEGEAPCVIVSEEAELHEFEI